MARDYAAEFMKLFKSGSCSIRNKDWTAPKFFDSQNNDCYAAEAALMSSLTSEAFGNFGFEVQYYIKDITTKQDRLYGEDPLENVRRRFTLKMYAEQLPAYQKTYTLQGMTYEEVITCMCTIQHFMEASRYEYGTNQIKYNSEVPKIGDIIYLEYSDLFYEVINVKTFAEGTSFLSSPITYTFTLRIWRNTHQNVDIDNLNEDNMDKMRTFSELDEIFDIDEKASTGHPTSKVGPDSDILEINKDLPKDKTDEDKPKDNVNSHVEYKYPEPSVEYDDERPMDNNKKYYDPFQGW